MYVEHLRIPIGSGSLHTERVGRGGPPVVLLHGFGTSSFLWRRLAVALANNGYTALAFDLLGHGESDRPPDVRYGLEAQAEYLTRALAALRLPAVTVVGQDVGGLVGLLLGTAQGARVSSTVLLEPPDPDDLPGAEIRTLQRASARVALNTQTLFGSLHLLEPLLKAGVTDADRMPERLVARYVAPFVGVEGLRALLQRAAAVELTPVGRGRISQATGAVLVLQAEGGSPRPSLSWPTVLPAAQVVVERLAGVGRLIPEDAPEALEPRILAWLTAQRNH